MTERTTSIPRYREIANKVIEEITTGTYGVGAALPTEAELGERYGASRHTIREAVRYVQSVGMVLRRQGSRTRVIANKARREYRLNIRTFSDIEQHGYFTHLVDLKTSRVVADEELAEELPCAVGEAFLRLDCYRVPIDDSVPIPTAWNSTYIIDAYAEVHRSIPQADGPVYQLIEQMFAEEVNEIDQDVRSVDLGPALARRLNVKTHSPGLQIKRTYYGRGRRPVMFGYNTYPGAHFSLSMRLRHE